METLIASDPKPGALDPGWRFESKTVGCQSVQGRASAYRTCAGPERVRASRTAPAAEYRGGALYPFPLIPPVCDHIGSDAKTKPVGASMIIVLFISLPVLGSF